MKNWPRVFTILCLAALWASAGSAQNYAVGQSAAQRAPRESQAGQPSNCIHVLYCLFNQEAMASDPAGIHKYSRDLVDLILPNQWTYGRYWNGGGAAFSIGGGPESRRLLLIYPSSHNRRETNALFNHLADEIGF
ncbi:MAG: hypothetical protein ACP5E2_02495 [Terracidiphilus sp.]